MKVSGKELIGLTGSEILEEMFAVKCPHDINDILNYEECELRGTKANCLSCWLYNLKKEYEIESEE